jgi:hypothetical protein
LYQLLEHAKTVKHSWPLDMILKVEQRNLDPSRGTTRMRESELKARRYTLSRSTHSELATKCFLVVPAQLSTVSAENLEDFVSCVLVFDDLQRTREDEFLIRITRT